MAILKFLFSSFKLFNSVVFLAINLELESFSFFNKFISSCFLIKSLFISSICFFKLSISVNILGNFSNSESILFLSSFNFDVSSFNVFESSFNSFIV